MSSSPPSLPKAIMQNALEKCWGDLSRSVCTVDQNLSSAALTRASARWVSSSSISSVGLSRHRSFVPMRSISLLRKILISSSQRASSSDAVERVFNSESISLVVRFLCRFSGWVVHSRKSGFLMRVWERNMLVEKMLRRISRRFGWLSSCLKCWIGLSRERTKRSH